MAELLPVFVQGVLGLLQKDLGEKYGISPGSDMCAAVLSAREIGAVVVLIDRDIEVTMNRLLAVPFREFWGLVSSKAGDETKVIAGLLNNNIEGILEGENLKKIIEEFRKRLPGIYGALIDERDQYMAFNLARIQQQNPEKNVVAVVGAGHKAGIERCLADIGAGYTVDMPALNKMKKTSLFKVLFIAALIFFAFFLIKTESLFRR